MASEYIATVVELWRSRGCYVIETLSPELVKNIEIPF